MQVKTQAGFNRSKNRNYKRISNRGASVEKKRTRDQLSSILKRMGVSIIFPRDSKIYGEREPAKYIYNIISGAVRSYKLLDDGRRQINAFYVAGDVFGLETGARHRFSAEAIITSSVLVVKRSALTAVSAREIDVANELWTLTAHGLERVQNLMMTLGRKNAQERVASFLLEMAGRGSDKNTIELPMSRRDIADYLGLTVETVSRTFTQLENNAVIALPSSRRVVLRNHNALNLLNA